MKRIVLTLMVGLTLAITTLAQNQADTPAKQTDREVKISAEAAKAIGEILAEREKLRPYVTRDELLAARLEAIAMRELAKAGKDPDKFTVDRNEKGELVIVAREEPKPKAQVKQQ